MRTILALLLAATLISPAMAKDFKGTSYKVGFTVVGEITGSYSRLSNGIAVEIKSGVLKLKNPDKKRYAELGIQGISAILVHYKPDRVHFEMIASSEPISINELVTEPVEIPKAKLTIPTKGIPYAALKNAWLAFEIRIGSLTEVNRTGLVYIHTPTFLFGDKFTEFPYSQ